MLPLSLTWSETCCYYHGLASICIRRCGPPLKATFSKWPSRQINCPSLSLRAAATWASERFIPGGGGQRWSFPEGGQKDFFQDGATVAKFHFANSKARVKIIIYQKVNRILSPTCPPPTPTTSDHLFLDSTSGFVLSITALFPDARAFLHAATHFCQVFIVSCRKRAPR